MDFSRRFAVIEVPAYDAAQCSYAAQMELFSLGFDLLISHRPGATDKQKHRAQRHGVEWNYCVFASSLFSGDGAIGSVFSRSD
jgi:hypothetical protein